MCRTLAACKVDWAIVAHSNDDTILHSEYRCRVSAVRRKRTLDFKDISECISKARQRSSTAFVIAPTSEALNLFLLNHRTEIESAGDVVPIPSEALYRRISNKRPFVTLCREFDIPVPHELDRGATPQLPLVAKPVVEITAAGERLTPVLIHNDQEWAAFKARPDSQHYFLQDYVKGPSFYLQWYFYRSGRIDRFSMRNLVQQPHGKSIVAAVPAEVHTDAAYKAVETLFLGVKFEGLVMVEIMLEHGGFRVIEANPRMWGPSQLMIDAGSNLLVSFVNDHLGLDIPLDICPVHDSPRYFWWSGFWEPQLRGLPMKWHCPPAEFWAQYPEMVCSEVYCRPDARGIFYLEASSLSVPRGV
jgi:predicted ATP-grasp superfamily ATP-dependent carboligase